MPFPHQDPSWRQTAHFIQQHAAPDAAILAPDEFVEIFENVYAYAAPSLNPTIRYEWIVVHKGLCDQMNQVFLQSALASIPAVLANDVFVVFSKKPGLGPLPVSSPHVQALRGLLQQIAREGKAVPLPPNAKVRPMNFGKLDVEGVREAMNERYSKDAHDEFGGYEHPHEWDRVRFHEVDRLFEKLIGDVSGLSVLEIGCGIGRNARFFECAASYLGTDLSDVAIRKAQQRGFDPRYQFQTMNAMDLRLADSQYDLILGAEIIEHVQDAELMLREVHRVLKPGGRFLFNSANRDSLHLQVIQALGYPEVRSTHEHFREFGYGEIQEILDRFGFDTIASEGVFLHPYLSIPGIDNKVRDCIINDPNLVEIMRSLGNRIGPQYCFEFMISARKR